jgi:hypothetical protein
MGLIVGIAVNTVSGIWLWLVFGHHFCIELDVTNLHVTIAQPFGYMSSFEMSFLPACRNSRRRASSYGSVGIIS